MGISSLLPDDRPALMKGVGTLAFLAIASMTFAQGRSPSAIHDAAGMFSEEAVAKADTELDRYKLKYRIPIVVETIEALRGQSIDEAARRHARQMGGEEIYILASRRDHKIEVLVSDAFAKLIPDPKRLAIRNAFVEGFKEGDFDAGLLRGVQMIGTVLAGEKRAENAPESERSLPAEATDDRERGVGASRLVLRNQVRLTLDGARRIVAGAEAKAAEMDLKMNVAVVDEGGHMLAFERMDGARPASGYTATTKAVTAATFRAATGPIPAGTSSPDPLLNLSLQNAALASGGKITTLHGGVPIVVNDQVIGGVGVGGGSGEQDTTVARAGLDAFLAELNVHEEAPKAP